MKKFFIISAFLVLAGWAPVHAQVQMSKEQIQFYTANWKGERFPDGRPKVPDALVKRLVNVSIEEAWGVLRGEGFHNQFEGNWQMIHRDKPFVGRALTAQYMPMRADMNKALAERAKEEKRVGPPNSWPIDMLQVGDVYVADGYGKIIDGTLIGDNLGNSIYAKTKNGVVFDAGVRDLEGLEKIEGFNGLVRGFDPTAINQMQMTCINCPVRIGHATVLPGDLVLAKKEGVIFIPAYLAEKVVQESEFIALQDSFGHQRLREGKYTPGEIDTKWNDTIKKDFLQWIDQNAAKLPMPRAELDKLMKSKNW